jgi:hypothetical protein
LAIFLLSGYLSATPLDDYVKAPDPHFNYELIKTYEMDGYKLFILNMTSQKWLDGFENKFIFNKRLQFKLN